MSQDDEAQLLSHTLQATLELNRVARDSAVPVDDVKRVILELRAMPNAIREILEDEIEHEARRVELRDLDAEERQCR